MIRTPKPAVTFVIRGDRDRILHLRKELKHLAIDSGRTMSELLLAAIDQLMASHKKTATARSEEVAS